MCSIHIYIPEPLVTSEVDSVTPMEYIILEHPPGALLADDCILF